MITKDSNYFRYIDDILLLYPRNNDFKEITSRLNYLESTIDFTYKHENNIAQSAGALEYTDCFSAER